jgi:hypothetical protein
MPASSAAAPPAGSPWQLSAPSVSRMVAYDRHAFALSHEMIGVR